MPLFARSFPVKKYLLGLVGHGKMGRFLAANFYAHQGFEVVAVCDADPASNFSDTPYHTAAFYTDAQKIIQDKHIELVVVATPPTAHFEVARAALAVSKNVLVEKPITDNFKQAQELVELAHAKNCLLAVDHTLLYEEAVNFFVRDFLMVGNPEKIKFVRTQKAPPHKNCFEEMMPHILALLDNFDGFRSRQISVALGSGDLARKVSAEVLTESGIVAHIDIVFAENLAADRQTRRADILRADGARLVWDEARDANGEQIIRVTENGNTKKIKAGKELPLARMVNNIYEALGDHHLLVSSGVGGARVMQLMDAVRLSAERGGEKISVTMEF